jgi:cell division protein FtsL
MKKRRIPVLAIIVSLLAIIIVGGIWFWNTHKKRIIRSQLEKAIREKSKGLYKVKYEDLSLDEVNGDLSVSLFSLNYDSLEYNRLLKEKKEPPILFNIFIPKIEVRGVKTPKALLDKEISGSRLTIINPVIQILYTNAGKDSTRAVPDKEIYEQILGNLNLIKLDSVTITGAEIITKDLKTGKALVHFLNTSISLLNVAVDSVANADTTRLLFAKEINLVCEKFTWQSQDKLYNYEVDSIAFQSALSSVSIKNIRVIPLLKEDAFARAISLQTDRLDFAIHDVKLKNVDFYQLADEEINIDTVLIGSASFKLYRDRVVPRDHKNRVGTYPQQSLQKMSVPLIIKKAIIKNTFIEYKERNTVTNQSGKVQFTNLSGTISNITNRKDIMDSNSLMIADIQTQFLGKVPLHTKWTFHLGNPDGKFSIQGNMGATAAETFNIVAVPLGPARLNSGQVHELAFNMNGTNYQMTGQVKMLYDDLRISLLKKDDDSVHYKKKGIASWIANLKIKNANPDKGKEVRTGKIDYKRDVNKSIFNFTWKSLFEGVKEITGAK